MHSLERFLNGVRFLWIENNCFSFCCLFRLGKTSYNFLKVILTVFFMACFGFFFRIYLSIESVSVWTTNSLPMRFSDDTIIFRAHGRATCPIITARAPLSVMSWVLWQVQLIMKARVHFPNQKTFETLKSNQFQSSETGTIYGFFVGMT